MRELFWCVCREFICYETLKRRRVCDTRSENVQVPQLCEKGQDGRVRVCAFMALCLGFNNAFAHPWRDQKCGDSNSQSCEIECNGFAVWCVLSMIQIISSWNLNWRGNVITETAMLVKGENEKCILPLW